MPKRVRTHHAAYLELALQVSFQKLPQYALASVQAGHEPQGRFRIMLFFMAPLDRETFLGTALRLLQADIVAMPAKGRDEPWNIVKTAAYGGKTRKVFKVHANAVVAIQ